MAETPEVSGGRRRRCLDDFGLEETVGEGSYGEVRIALEYETGKRFAAKILSKRQIIKVNKSQYVGSEKVILNTLSHPNIVQLHCTFQDKENLYFIIELCPNGDLLSQLKKVGAFDLECARFYAAEVLSALAYMHSKHIVHRDIKPENILLGTTMHAKVSDFGCAKQLNELTARSNSFCGTAEYVCPELLVEKSAGIQADMWSFGCMLYQLLTGRLPFRGFNDYSTFQAIIKNEYVTPDWMSAEAADLIKKLLVANSAERLSAEQAKQHPFFAGLNWEDVHEQAPPAITPSPYFVPLSPGSAHISPPDSPPLRDLEELSPSSSPVDSSSPLSCTAEPLSASGSTVRETSASISSNVSASPPSTPPSSPPSQSFVSRTMQVHHKRSESAHTSKWNFLNVDEEVLKTGMMNKRSGFSSRKRLVFITNQRLVLVNPKGKVKCSVRWNEDSLTTSIKSGKALVLTTSTQTFKLLVPTEDAQVWIDEISLHHKPLRPITDHNGSSSINSKEVSISIGTSSVSTHKTKRSNSIL